ncbi:MAG: PIN domain-containing protein [Comamonadaceae bacterium]|nr:PIN domain-containing protein [Comamonadaceae bacterium]RRD58155.1 PIN domain-containing protein [Comamonadaceae bacterium OH2545_COT-014]
MLPDANVIVAASRADHPCHAAAHRWLQGMGGAPLSLAMPVAADFLRLVTHPRVFPAPTPVADAVAFVDWLLQDAGAQWAASGAPGSAEWPALRQLVLEGLFSGHQVSDAYLAALARSRGEPCVTFDTGMRRLLPRSLLVLLPVS